MSPNLKQEMVGMRGEGSGKMIRILLLVVFAMVTMSVGPAWASPGAHIVNGCMVNAAGKRNPEYANIENVFLIWEYRGNEHVPKDSPFREDILKKRVTDFLIDNHVNCTERKSLEVIESNDFRINDKNNITFFVRFIVDKDWVTGDFFGNIQFSSFRPDYWGVLIRRDRAAALNLKEKKEKAMSLINSGLVHSFGVYGGLGGYKIAP